MPTLNDAFQAACRYWNTRRGAKVMETRARICVDLIGGSHDIKSIGTRTGTDLLVGLSKRGLSRKSQGDYYATFKRMLALSGIPTVGWPRGPEPERRTRDPISTDDAHRIMERLRASGQGDSADLGLLLFATGLRVGVEGLTPDHLTVRSDGDGHTLLHITGKGGHERFVPVVSEPCRALLRDRGRLAAVYRVPYRTHLARWNAAKTAEGVTSRLATFHALRHRFATSALKASGGNLKLVQELLGHASPSTTALYAIVGLDEKLKALHG